MLSRFPHAAATLRIGRGALLLARACGAAAALTLATAPIAAQAQPVGPSPLELLVSPTATLDQRVGAATQLLQSPRHAADVPGALALLGEDPTGGEAARTLLQVLARLPQAPAAAQPAVLAIARDSAHPLRLDAVRALGAFHTREAAAALVDLLGQSQAPLIRDAAFRSLASLSGRDDLGFDAERWREWLATMLGLGERQWEQELLAAHLRRTQRLEGSLAESERRVLDAWRQIHLLTPIEERSAVLVRLLESDAASLRDLGFELANREISESRVLQPTVAETSIRLLQSPDPLVRAQAALLINRLVPPQAEAPVLSALERETDPRAADALMLAATRWPSPAALRPALRWLEDSPQLRVRAAGLAWALLRAGHLEEPADRAAVLRSVRSLDTSALTGPASRLLALLGEREDIARIQGLLESPEPAVRATAADALGLRADQVNFLLAAATDDPSVFEATARAAKAHLHNARGYDALARLPAPSPQVRTRVLADYASVLSTEELVRLAKLVSDPADALPLLNPLAASERLATPEAQPELGEGLLLLARTHVALGSPGDALTALSLIPAGAAPVPEAELTDLRAMLLLWLNRIDQAESMEASPEAWLDALEQAVAEPHAGVIASRLETRFEGKLTEEQRERLARLVRQVAEVDDALDETGG